MYQWRANRALFKKPRTDLCQECKGRGETKETRPEYETGPDKKLRRVAAGSGCEKCRGIGLTNNSASR